MEWISVSERLPRSQETFAGPNTASDCIIAGRYSQSSNLWIVGIEERKELGTNYWQYWLDFTLPAAPRSAGKEQR